MYCRRTSSRYPSLCLNKYIYNIAVIGKVQLHQDPGPELDLSQNRFIQLAEAYPGFEFDQEFSRSGV